MNKNILMIGYSNFFSDQRIIKEAEAAVEGGFSVDVITLFDEKRRKNYKQINVISVNQKKYRGDSKLVYTFAYLEFFLRCFFLTTYLYIVKNYRIIHINNIPDWMVFAAFIPKLFGSKIILDIHDPLSITYSTKFLHKKKTIFLSLLKIAEKISWCYADRIITVNEIVFLELISKNYTDSNKISVISNFVDTNKFPYSDDYSIKGKLKIIYHGTISERFGLDDVLLAISNLKNKEEIHFKIVGTGDYEEALKQKIYKYQLNEIVIFDNNIYDVDELNKIIKKFSIGIVPYKDLPSTQYLLPVKLQEYISIGLPVITIKSKTIKHYYKPNELIYYDNQNINSLTNLLDSLLSNRNKLLDIFYNNIDLRKKYTWDDEKINYINILKKIVGERIN